MDKLKTFFSKNGIAFYVFALAGLLALVAMILGAVSSSVTSYYAIKNIGWIVALSIIAILLICGALALAHRNGNSIYVYLAIVVALVLLGICFALVIMERTNLMGYVWFTSLDASNPLAVSAMNSAGGSFIIYLISMALCVIGGFFKIVNE